MSETRYGPGDDDYGRNPNPFGKEEPKRNLSPLIATSQNHIDGLNEEILEQGKQIIVLEKELWQERGKKQLAQEIITKIIRAYEMREDEGVALMDEIQAAKKYLNAR